MGTNVTILVTSHNNYISRSISSALVEIMTGIRLKQFEYNEIDTAEKTFINKSLSLFKTKHI